MMRLLSVITAGFVLLFLASCTFSHLTTVQSDDPTAPDAAECGSCHQDQYREWMESAHARAYTSAPYKIQTDDYQAEECLVCHIPGQVLGGIGEVRNSNRSEGINCISCHLYDNSMQGPHESGALFSPHSVSRNLQLDSREAASARFCGECHLESYRQWDEQYGGKGKDSPSCLQCHARPVSRRHTRGSNFFTDILVSFEPVHEVRSHALILSDPEAVESRLQLNLAEGSTDEMTFRLKNSLPHDLPTGEYGDKDLFVTVFWQRADGTVTFRETVMLPVVIPPGEEFEFSVSHGGSSGITAVTVQLFRRDGQSGEERVIASFSPFPVSFQGVNP